MTWAEALAWGVAAGAYVHTTMAAVAMVLVAWYRRGRPADVPLPPVSILRPLEGDDPGLAQNLDAFYRAPWPSKRQMIFCLPNLDDAAARLCEEVAAQHPEIETVLATSDGGPTWKNRKIRHLIAGLEHARYDTLVFADADMSAPPRTLEALLTPVVKGEAAVVYGASSYRPEGTAASALQSAALGHGFHAFMVLDALSRFTRGIPAMVGGLWATTQSHLTAIGGLEVAGDHIGDDLALAEAAHRAGLAVFISRKPAVCVERDLTLATLTQRLTRWIAVVGAHQRHKLAGYPGLIAQLPLLLIGGAAAAAAGQSWPLFSVALALVARFVMALYLGRLAGLPWRPGLMLWVIAADCLLLAAFVAAVGRSEVVWRGRTYRLTRGGAIEEVQ